MTGAGLKAATTRPFLATRERATRSIKRPAKVKVIGAFQVHLVDPPKPRGDTNHSLRLPYFIRADRRRRTTPRGCRHWSHRRDERTRNTNARSPRSKTGRACDKSPSRLAVVKRRHESAVGQSDRGAPVRRVQRRTPRQKAVWPCGPAPPPGGTARASPVACGCRPHGAPARFWGRTRHTRHLRLRPA